MEFVSLKAITYDILSIIRGSEISDDEVISERQIESWIHQYRSILLKRDLDKGKKINPDYIQTMANLELEYDEDLELYCTAIDLPKTIDLNYNSGLTVIYDADGNQIQLVPESRAIWQDYKRASQDDTIAYLKNNKLYLRNPHGLSYVSLKGVFEIPPAIPVALGEEYSDDNYYPIPINLLPALKKEILKGELNIEWDAPSDEKNNADHKVEE